MSLARMYQVAMKMMAAAAKPRPFKARIYGIPFMDRRCGWATEDVDGVEPGLGEGGPVGDGKFCGTEAVAVAALGEDVQLGGNLCLF